MRYGSREVLTRVSLDVRVGEFVCLLGPSGCGKTTLLNAIAGFIPVSDGRITVDGVEVGGPGADRGMVFQEYALFPWFTVEQNVVYGPKLRGASRQELRRLADHYLTLVKLDKYGHCYPNQLSGGQRQRVALARALANQPKILLMDEPFGALDTHTKLNLHAELLALWEARHQTVVFVTHDLSEAITLADRVIVMTRRPGRVKLVHEVKLPRPRDVIALRETDAYAREYGRLWHVLGEELAERA